MNTALIKKYKKEFDHYLNEGKVLMNIPSDIRGWILPDWDLPTNTLVITDDEYTEFRKAEAEGKQIQFRTKENNKWVDCTFKSWDESFKYSDTEFKIKPEEDYFKVGDIVVSNEYGTIMLTTANVDSYNKNSDVHNKNSPVYTRKWIPTHGELYLFYNDKNDVPHVGIYETSFLDCYWENIGHDLCDNSRIHLKDWKYCEPLIRIKGYIK